MGAEFAYPVHVLPPSVEILKLSRKKKSFSLSSQKWRLGALAVPSKIMFAPPAAGMIAGATFVKISPAAARVADSVYTTGGGEGVPVGTKSESGTSTV
jgi:hypothetical protein